jgi:hypothetical protein
MSCAIAQNSRERKMNVKRYIDYVYPSFSLLPYHDGKSDGFDATEGFGRSCSSMGGGALVSPRRRFSSSSRYLSMSSERPSKGRLPRRAIMSSLCNVRHEHIAAADKTITYRVNTSFSNSLCATFSTSARLEVKSSCVRLCAFLKIKHQLRDNKI